MILLGNLTRDPEVRFTPNGTAVCDIGLAVNRKWKNQADELQEEVTFVDVTLWGRTAMVAGDYLTKGKPVMLEGRLHLEQWHDRQTGEKRQKLKVIGETLQLLGSGGGQQSGQRTQPASGEESAASGEYDHAFAGPPSEAEVSF